MQHRVIYRAPGRYAGWPANYGMWGWGDELVVAFTVGYHDPNGGFHARDRSRPFVTMQARSVDGGETWQAELMPCRTPGGRGLSADEHMTRELGVRQTLQADPGALIDPPGGIDLTAPDLAVMCARAGLRAGAISWYYASHDRCHSWAGPFRLPMFGQAGIAARTDVVVLDKDTGLFFLTAAKPDGQEGRVFCALTTDGGGRFAFRSWVTPEAAGYTIMPSSVRLPSGRLLSAVRCRDGDRCWIDLYVSDDDAATWRCVARPAPDTGSGGNPPALIQLGDRRLCLTYGYRDPPFGMRARLSADGGATWGPEIVLRDGAGNHDLGYPRSVQRADGQVVTAYYWNDEPDGERYIAATVWRP
ncbi:MAG: exo-alpha-sialidase [Anaerolineae bacterium]|nr:exo-alpha-sialidase [Anaerolineae bacterium]